jgi:cytochrome c oxidase subunit 2
MWKFQHLEGQREINELHIPAGRPVKITISSEDVLHSLYFPAFRTKMDAIPGRYTELWFEAQTPACTTSSARVLRHQSLRHDRQRDRARAAQYQAWLQGGGMEGTLAQRGAKLFNDLACSTCHLDTGQGRGPRSRTSSARRWSCRTDRRWSSMKPTCANRS